MKCRSVEKEGCVINEGKSAIMRAKNPKADRADEAEREMQWKLKGLKCEVFEATKNATKSRSEL